MNSFDWIQIIYGLIAATIGYFSRLIWVYFLTHRSAIGQRALLSGIDNPLLFVFPPREEVDSAVLPRISVEDFLAINNIISALIQIGWKGEYKIRDTQHLSEDDKKKYNMIFICSSKTNEKTGEVLEKLRSINNRMNDLVPYFEKDDSNRVQIKWNKGTYPSDSYDQEGPELNDIAIVVKARSPWAGQRKIMVVAGIRGFGTWGAAECLKKWWKVIYHAKGSSIKRHMSKKGDFVALLNIRYESYDIKAANLLHLVDLDKELYDIK